MHILHISNSYGGTEVYTQLIKSLDNLGVKQTVFVPLNPNNTARKGNFLIDFTVPGSSIIYSTRLNHYHRFLYGLKIRAIKNEIEKQVDVKSIDLIHAGLFCSDGAAAFELSKVYKIPYVVAVRNTDINSYYRRMWWRRWYFHRILSHAKKIIFISHQYRKALFELVKNSEIFDLKSKSVVVPNGLNSFYLINKIQQAKRIHSPVRIIYAGAINKGKNILEALKAVEILIDKGYLIEFIIIGKGLKYRKEDTGYLEKIRRMAFGKTWIHILDSLGKEELRNAFTEGDIFVMPSTPETFGIVYLEALSQGLPIVYARGQGFDGYYEGREIGFSVDPKDPTDIANKIKFIIDNYDKFALNVSRLDLYADFSWDKISQTYFNLYKETKQSENRTINIS